jgi:hypothetical protein
MKFNKYTTKPEETKSLVSVHSVPYTRHRVHYPHMKRAEQTAVFSCVALTVTQHVYCRYEYWHMRITSYSGRSADSYNSGEFQEKIQNHFRLLTCKMIKCLANFGQSLCDTPGTLTVKVVVFWLLTPMFRRAAMTPSSGWSHWGLEVDTFMEHFCENHKSTCSIYFAQSFSFWFILDDLRSFYLRA